MKDGPRIDFVSMLPDIMALAPSALPKLVAQINFLARDDGPARQAGTNARAAAARGGARSGSTAVIPIVGIILPKPNWMSDILGWSTAAGIKTAVEEAAADDTVSQIMLSVDSPGGDVVGVPEAADAIFAARDEKPVVAFIDGLGASAAYFLASQADRVTMLGSGEAGSVGVICTHVDVSRANQTDGITVTYLTSTKYKGEMNPDTPLSPDAKAYQMGRIMDYHSQFVGAVARGRSVPAATVESTFGQGRLFGSAQAVKVGMVDGVASSLSDALSPAKRGRSSMAAEIKLLAKYERDSLVDCYYDPELAAMLRAQGFKPERT